MENKKELGTGAIIGIVVLAVLSIAELIINIIFSIKYYSTSAILLELVPYILLFVAITYYAIAGYKKPHGNLLRFVFLLFSLSCLCTLISQMFDTGIEGKACFSFLIGIAALLAAYTGGRLDKIKKNRLPLIIIGLVLIIKPILGCFEHGGFQFMFFVWGMSTFVLWLDIAFAYILRYKEHKEAGLADK